MRKCNLKSGPSGTVFDLDGIRVQITDLELEMQLPDFWKDHEKAGKISKELNNLKDELAFWEKAELKLEKFSNLGDLEIAEAEREVREFNKNFDREYIKIFLFGRYDTGNALLYIYSGAGGIDAQDWASMLLRMYQKYSQNADFGFTLLHQSFGEQGGTKNAVAEITGRWAYGYLKGESGVHRLVRISPFSAKSLRHTSFVLVDVLPEIEDVKIAIDSKDLKIDTFRSSGPGGQNVNKLETAVRITHIPTGLAVAVQSERSQAQNKAKAMALLSSRLAQLMEEKKVKEISDLRVETKDSAIEWGSQIRSYVLHPYQMVKDHRTNVETSQIDKVLEGGIEEFIEAELTND